MQGPREVPIHASLNRPNLVAGGDRELVLSAGAFSATFCFAVITWWGILIGLSIWPIAVSLLRKMAKADPQMRDVAIRAFGYRGFYPEKSRLSAASVRQRKSWR